MELGNGWYALTTVKFGKKSTVQNSCKNGSLKILSFLICSIEYAKFKCKRMYLIDVGYFETRHKCRQCVLFNKRLVWCYKVCIHKRVTFDIITPPVERGFLAVIISNANLYYFTRTLYNKPAPEHIHFKIHVKTFLFNSMVHSNDYCGLCFEYKLI